MKKIMTFEEILRLPDNELREYALWLSTVPMDDSIRGSDGNVDAWKYAGALSAAVIVLAARMDRVRK